jgi:hypothetical protein
LLIGQIESQRKGKANALPPLLPPPPSEPGDPAYGDRVLSVLVGETRRAQAQLRLPVAGAPPPHRVTAELDDRLEFEARASFGALVNSALFRSRPTRLEVVVGDDVLDSRRWEGDEDDGSPARRPSLTVDDVPQSLARDLWLSADDSYKAALLRLHLKTSELQRRPDEQRAPDWTSEPGREAIRPRMALQFDRTAGEALVRAVSAALRDVPGLREGSAKLTVRQSNRYLVDTDGMRIVQPESLVHLRIELQLLLPDGESLADHRDYVVDAIDELPATSSLQRDAKEAASRLRARSEAPVVPYYEGPVMFEGRAASDFFRYLLANELAGTPPAPEAGASLAQTLNHAPRLGRRLLPRGWTVRDDPQRQVDSMPGGYAFDREGVPGDAIELVDDGVIVDLAMTRTPRPDLGSSNGHARGPVSAEPTARLSHWEVRPPRTLPGPAVRRQLRRSMRQARLDRLLVVRALAEGREGDLPDPTDAYFVLADGSEQPVRALQWDGVDRRTLRAIVLAAGTQTRGYVAPDRPGGYSPDGDGVPQTLTSPARLLVDSLELSWPGPDAARPVLPELPLDPAP